MTRKPSGFVRFIRKVEKKGNSNDEHSFSPEKVLGSELYQRYEKLLEWIAGECNWRYYLDWVLCLSDSQRQDCMSLRNSLGISQFTIDSMGMYNGDRSGTLGKAVERILSDHQSEQQDAVSSGATRERFNPSPEYTGFNRYYP